TWVRQASGETLEAYLLHRPLHPGGPEALLPAWALDVYRSLRAEAGGDRAAAPPPAANGDAGPSSRRKDWA
ncbi:MAG TPA: hypothetical protein VFQ80_01100, partial [Thermomicrobiales bacterium]|nr:hypothetical protein [Thermomicrobiales bacterium]